jgi:hypothetical protein
MTDQPATCPAVHPDGFQCERRQPHGVAHWYIRTDYTPGDYTSTWPILWTATP